VTADAGQIALLLKEAQGQNANARIITAGGSNSPIQVNRLAGDDATNGTLSTMFLPVWDPSLAADAEGAQSFLGTWKAGGFDLGEATEGVRRYTAIKVLAAAFEDVKDAKESQEVRDVLANVKVAGAIYGDISFGDWNDLVNQNTPPVYLVQSQQGELKLGQGRTALLTVLTSAGAEGIPSRAPATPSRGAAGVRACVAQFVGPAARSNASDRVRSAADPRTRSA
jgi:branched-chain amino acid transport system substrate-binding protein